MLCETEVRECASDPCENGGSCEEQINGYNCVCTPGFAGMSEIFQ